MSATAERRRRAQAEFTAGMVELNPSQRGVRAERKADQLAIQAVRDAEVLAGGEIMGQRGAGRTAIKIQSTALSRSLLWRAGIKFQRRFAFYEVIAMKDRFNRWQLATQQGSGVVA